MHLRPRTIDRFARWGLVLAALCLVGPWVGGCNKEDVGAPCNHGQVDPPKSKLVTFPALSCNELLCVYADEEEPSEDPCNSDADCNEDLATQKFACVENECELRIDYVLERSMCSKNCTSDSDCSGKRVVVEGTKCEGGFKCARIQTLGQFCCRPLCVCSDDLALDTADEIRMACETGEQEGCCRKDGIPVTPTPEGCGL
jgi:hypothetical protein